MPLVQFLALPDAADLTMAAQKSRYRFDELAKLLSQPPKWASTRPARPSSRSAKHDRQDGRSRRAARSRKTRKSPRVTSARSRGQ